jgi:hypothetical protein
MKTVHELTTQELEELRDTYFAQLQDQGEEDEIHSPHEIPMENVIQHYEGIMFVEDDFFCNVKD